MENRDEVRMSFSNELKQAIVNEIESGRVSIRDAAKQSYTTITRIKLWLEEYGKFKPKKNTLEVIMKSEQEKISELEKALAEAHLKIRVYDEIIDLAGKKYREDLKKSFGTQPYEMSGGKRDKKSKRSVRQ